MIQRLNTIRNEKVYYIFNNLDTIETVKAKLKKKVKRSAIKTNQIKILITKKVA
jgi:hypothetical protein